MMANGGAPTSGTPTHAHVVAARESRWLGQEYADITKLRELAAKHDHLAARWTSKQARYLVKVEKLRHVATLYREKAELFRGKAPVYQQQIDEFAREVQQINERGRGVTLGSDVTRLHYRMQKLQQRIVNLKDKAQKCEHKAAIRTQKASELKVRSDEFLEHARAEALEAQAYRDRADRLQRATEGSFAAGTTAVAPVAPIRPA